MFNIFRRSRPTPLTTAGPEAAQQQQQAPQTNAGVAPRQPVTVDVDPALPEVVESSDETNWRLWEQAVTGQAGAVGSKSQWEKTWPGMEAPPPATPSQLEETVRMVRRPIEPPAKS